MRVNVGRLNPDELAALVTAGEQRLEDMRRAASRLPEAQRNLEEALGERDRISAEIRALRAEIEGLQNTIKPKRRRKATPEAAAEAPDDAIAAE